MRRGQTTPIYLGIEPIYSRFVSQVHEVGYPTTCAIVDRFGSGFTARDGEGSEEDTRLNGREGNISQIEETSTLIRIPISSSSRIRICKDRIR